VATRNVAADGAEEDRQNQKEIVGAAKSRYYNHGMQFSTEGLSSAPGGNPAISIFNTVSGICELDSLLVQFILLSDVRLLRLSGRDSPRCPATTVQAHEKPPKSFNRRKAAASNYCGFEADTLHASEMPPPDRADGRVTRDVSGCLSQGQHFLAGQVDHAISLWIPRGCTECSDVKEFNEDC
jgi:hypothetical protein